MRFLAAVVVLPVVLTLLVFKFCTVTVVLFLFVTVTVGVVAVVVVVVSFILSRLLLSMLLLVFNVVVAVTVVAAPSMEPLDVFDRLRCCSEDTDNNSLELPLFVKCFIFRDCMSCSTLSTTSMASFECLLNEPLALLLLLPFISWSLVDDGVVEDGGEAFKASSRLPSVLAVGMEKSVSESGGGGTGLVEAVSL